MVVRQQAGIVLLTTLMMLMIMTLLVTSLMQSVFLYIKSSHQVMTNHQIFREMEQLAYRLDRTNAACVARDKDPKQSVEMLLESQGCIMVEGEHQYRYLLAEQGIYPCLQVKSDNGTQGSQHWLVTIASMQQPKMIIQLRVANAIDTDHCELPKAHIINAGVISWRKLNFYLDRNTGHGKIFA